MSLATKLSLTIKPFARGLSCTPSVLTKQWRKEQGLSVHRTAEGVLTDAPDYTFLDGRPTPLLHKQKLRMEKQKKFASKIIQLSSEIDFAIEREQQMLRSKEEERQRVIGDRLKPKGYKLYKKTK